MQYYNYYAAEQPQPPITQPQSPQYIPASNPNQFMISQETRERAFLSRQKHLQDLEKKRFDNLSKEYLLDKKNDLEERREKTREENQIKRDMAQLRGFENADGNFCVEYRFPDGNIVGRIIVLHVTKIRMVKESTCLGNYFHIFWKENPAGIVIKEEKFSVKSLVKGLETKGVILCVPRRKKSEAAEQLLQFLNNNQTEEKIACLFGWNKIGDEWFFNKEERRYDE